MSKPRVEPGMKRVTRTIEYYGDKEWVDTILAKSLFNINGRRDFGTDKFTIRLMDEKVEEA